MRVHDHVEAICFSRVSQGSALIETLMRSGQRPSDFKDIKDGIDFAAVA